MTYGRLKKALDFAGYDEAEIIVKTLMETESQFTVEKPTFESTPPDWIISAVDNMIAEKRKTA